MGAKASFSDVSSFRDRLRLHNIASQGKAEEGKVSSCSTPVRLVIFLLVLASSTFLTGRLMRLNVHRFQRPMIQDSFKPEHIRIRVSNMRKRAALVRPWTHSQDLHDSVAALKRLAEDPEELQAYQDMPESGKLAMLHRKQASERENITIETRCSSLEDTYLPLVRHQLSAFQHKLDLSREKLANQKHDYVAFAYIRKGVLFLDGTKNNLKHPMVRLWGYYLYHLSKKVDLPDVMLPMNADDFAIGGQDCWFSFCRRRQAQNDLLLPNTLEDELFFNIPDTPRHGIESQMSAAIWLGRPMSWERGHRKAILEASRTHPHKIFAGLTDWSNVPELENVSEEALADYYKPYIPLQKWADSFKYVINVPGNCGSARLAYQLYADALVFLVSSEDEEWYMSLLKPYVHYVPVDVHADGSTNLLQQILWADGNPDKVRDMKNAARNFAVQHLAPGSGRDCYSALLIDHFSRLMDNQTFSLPKGIQAFDPYTRP